MGIMRNILLWGSRSQYLREVLPRYRFMQKAVSRFMPGEHLDAAIDAARMLHAKGIVTVLTSLGENIMNESEARDVARHYLEVLDRVSTQSLNCHVSVKLTQLGLNLSAELCYANLTSIMERADKLKNFVWIDMESSAYTDMTLDLYHRARGQYPNVGICLQSYLHRTDNDLEGLLPLSPAIRLVKGAYAEPRTLAFHKKTDVDENFLVLAKRLLHERRQEGVWPGFATHDRQLVGQIQKEAGAMGLPKDAYEFQMLYGIQREEQLRLVQEGYRVRVLISYGEYWFPWYMRRLAERPANVTFVLKNIFTR